MQQDKVRRNPKPAEAVHPIFGRDQGDGPKPFERKRRKRLKLHRKAIQAALREAVVFNA